MKITIVFFFIYLISFSQETIILNDTNVPITKGFDKNPINLITLLLTDRKTEKEKFDRIFSWVVLNIRYDYKKSISTRGFYQPNIDKILKRKKGIDIDYAFIMDTLCDLVGIQNISISGYIKDELFNINDSLYSDNATWNAVKLDNLWYVYDASWCTGQYVLSYTKVSSIIDRWIRNISSREKKKINYYFKDIIDIRFKNKKKKCGQHKKNIFRVLIIKKGKLDSTLIEKVVTYKTSWLDQQLCNLLTKLTPRKKFIYSNITNQNFYLTNPEVFSITHFPTNPYWTLLDKKKIFTDYIQDSSFYYPQDEIYKNQNRQGKYCLECDYYFTSNELGKAKKTINSSNSSNPLNKFITSKNEIIVSDLLFKESFFESDSLSRVSLIDSALFHLLRAKKDISISLMRTKKYTQFQKDKNKTKLNFLLLENKKHIKKFESIEKITYQKTKKMKSFSSNTKSTKKRYSNYQQKLRQIIYKPQTSSNKSKTKEQISEIENKAAQIQLKIDSISSILTNLTFKYEGNLNLLKNKIRLDERKVWNLIHQYNSCSRLRWGQFDSYDKYIIDAKEKLNSNQSEYLSNFNDSIFKIADSCSALRFIINSMVKTRYILSCEKAKLLISLIQEKAIEEVQLKNLIDSSYSDIEDNICWLFDNQSLLNTVESGLNNIATSQKSIIKAILRENCAEKCRYNEIEKIINRKKKKLLSISNYNLKLIIVKKNNILQSKREYLKLF